MSQFQRGLLSSVAILMASLCCAGSASAVFHHHRHLSENKQVSQANQKTKERKHKLGHTAHSVVQYLGSKRLTAKLSRHHLRHHGQEVARQAKTRYAYPAGLFMLNPPAFEQSLFASDVSASMKSAFLQGLADNYPARALVRAGIVYYHPLRGGIFWRREPVKYVIIHSTETGIPLGATRVIESWSSMGRRHPGAQYVIDRDGMIYQAVDPDLASVHVNIFKTLPGINNDNSVGIEMCHSGKQEYTDTQVDSLVRLVVYLQGRYHVPDENVITHRYAQQGDHTDPVNFAWDQFIADKERLQRQSVVLKAAILNRDSATWQTAILPPPELLLELHQHIKLVPRAVAVPPKDITGGVTSHVRVRTETVATPIETPRRSVANVRLNLPLRGPIELEPSAVNLLEHNLEPSSVARVADYKKALPESPRMIADPGKPLDSGMLLDLRKVSDRAKPQASNGAGAPIPTGAP